MIKIIKTLLWAVPLLILLIWTMKREIPSRTTYVKPNEVIQEKKTREPQFPEELMRACSCESSYEGTPTGIPRQNRTHINGDGSTDFGACMLDSVHEQESKALGLDFKGSEKDNFRMALVIYQTQGIKAFHAYNPKTKNCVWAKAYGAGSR